MPKKVRQTIVLASGRGTRLRPLTNNRPRPLLPVLGRPCIEYVLLALDEAGVDEIFIACGYRASSLVQELGDTTPGGKDIIFAFEDEPAGTAGACKLLEDRIDGPFVVASGDVLADVDIGGLTEFHSSKGAFGTMALTTVERPEEFGIVGLDQDGRIERFKEKPATNEVFSNLINAGIYVLEREALEHIPSGQMFDFSKNLFPKLLGRGRSLFGATLEGMWKDIGRPSDLIEANIQMASRKGNYTPGPGLAPPLHMGNGVVIQAGGEVSSSVLDDDVSMGERCHVRGSLLMRGSRLGKDCQIVDSALGENCVVGEGSRLERCVLGDDVVIVPNTEMEDEKTDPERIFER
jgi:mannose-1-phosphate guanylyltransferase